ncbi:MAG: hypothetical protein ACK559_06850, partial [bacterium]
GEDAAGAAGEALVEGEQRGQHRVDPALRGGEVVGVDLAHAAAHLLEDAQADGGHVHRGLGRHEAHRLGVELEEAAEAALILEQAGRGGLEGGVGRAGLADEVDLG